MPRDFDFVGVVCGGAGCREGPLVDKIKRWGINGPLWLSGKR